MGGTITVLKWGLRNWYDEMVMFTGAGVLSALASLPFIVILAFGLILVGLPGGLDILLFLAIAPLLPSPALVGMFGLARELARGEGISWGLFWQTTRQYWLRSLVLYAISLAGTVLVLRSLVFYFSAGNEFLTIIGWVWVYVVILWLVMQMYLLPLLLEQERGSILRVYRNALIVAGAKPILSILILIVNLLFLVAGYFTVIGVPLVVLPIIACLSGHALRFAVYGKPKRPGEEEAEKANRKPTYRR